MGSLRGAAAVWAAATEGANYALKVEARFELFAAVYDALPGGGVAGAEAFDEIMRHLEAYEAEGRADVRRFIHRDPLAVHQQQQHRGKGAHACAGGGRRARV